VSIVSAMLRRISVPHEPGEWIEFKMPSWTEVERARDARRIYGLRSYRETADALGEQLLRDLNEQSAQARAEAQTSARQLAVAQNPWDTYDKATMLQIGINAWSYRDETGQPIPCTVDTVLQLDMLTAQWAGLTLIALIRSGFEPQTPEVVRGEDGEWVLQQPAAPDPLDFTPASTAP
jgi:hypothetical protein